MSKIVLFVFIVSVVSSMTGCSALKQEAQRSPSSDSAQAHQASPFVTVQGRQFFLNREPYAFVGTNLWYAAYLGSPNPHYGDRERLIRELDLLASLGVNNLRILGASEQSPLRDAISPSFTDKSGAVNQELLVGLDFVLSEMAKRDMKAVIYLNNFWEWSGGMATYLYWTNGGDIVDPSDPEKPWPAFALFSAQFYRSSEANQRYQAYMAQVINRRNTITGQAYKNDPTIMSWQLANEPRPGDRGVSVPYLDDYLKWVKDTTAFIKSHDENHLVSLGSEGFMGCLELRHCVIDAHKITGIDYMTFHMWLKNWGWFDVNNSEATFDSAIEKAHDYIASHIDMANELNMPMVLEEFGLDRDDGQYANGTPTGYRDQYFKIVFDSIEKSIENGDALVGSNFWAWGGYGRAEHDDARWRRGDTDYTGDPSQEPQGLNSVFSDDVSTLRILKTHSKMLRQLQ